jgi:tetratricopeptide (TPR) repeat protein
MSLPQQTTGQVVADRFEIQRLIGAGGMGEVFRAKDRLTGGLVAIKILHLASPTAKDLERFRLEAQLLAEISDPRVVRYVAHGVTNGNRLYLAMEWLDGEDLAERLTKDGLTIAETITLGRRVAEALGVLHERGIIHRDMKPSNIFLPNGDMQQVKILDLGIARMMNITRATGTGVLLGTPGYMAPEQARGSKEIDARADVFALGCVLFECITGRPAFMAENVAGLLAKILLEDSPRVSEIMSDVPNALDALIARMLSKHTISRPTNGGAVLRELELLDDSTLLGKPRHSEIREMRGLTRGEKKLVSIVMAASPESLRAVEPRAPTVDEEQRTVAATYDVRTIIAPFSAEFESLADGSLVVTVTGKGSATDQAVQAARCALALREYLPGAHISVATGFATLSDQLVLGDVIDRAAQVLANDFLETSEAGPSLIRLDETTAGLLDMRFDVGGDARGLVLRGRREIVSNARTLLGKPTRCVGRDRELSSLEALFEECTSEPVARPVLVSGPPGVGKSRLAHEFVRHVRERKEPAEVWIAHGDPMSEGAPFSMLAQTIRRAAGCLEGEALGVRQKKIRARVARHVKIDQVHRVSEFLAELVGAPFSDVESVQLRAARQDAMLMGDQMRRAWEDWLNAETAAQPVMLVLEDLHWGDLPSVKFIDAALRNLEDRPLMVVAFARPEVHEAFPALWGERGLQEIRLGALTKKASEQLVRGCLGENASEDVVASITARAAGNAFYLEELIRAVAEGRGDSLPDTVLAMVEARLERLDPAARRILRAAAVFGQAFWRGGILALVGGSHRGAEVDEWLHELCTREVITRTASSTFPGEVKYVFRHGLIREAAYAMLTPDDRVLGHRLAAEWLEEAGESDGMALAEHFERGGVPARAIEWYRRATAQAIEGNDFEAAMQRVGKAIACGATGETLGKLRLLQAEATNWSGDLREAVRWGNEAMRHLTRGSSEWFVAGGEVSAIAWRLGDNEKLLTLAEEFKDVGDDASVTVDRLIGMGRLVARLFYGGDFKVADGLMAWMELKGSEIKRQEPAVAGWFAHASANRAMWLNETEEEVRLLEQAMKSFEAAGDLRNACVHRQNLGNCLAIFGAYEEGEKHLRQALAEANRMGLSGTALACKHNLGGVLSRKGNLAGGITLEREAIVGFRARGDAMFEGASCAYLALMLRLDEKPKEAEEQAHRAVVLLHDAPSLHATALAILGLTVLERGRADEGYAFAKQGMDVFIEAGGVIEGEALVRLAYAEGLEATGHHEAARAAITVARDRLLARAEKIQDPLYRRGFLDRIREHALTLSCAGEWLKET